ncbi:MAG: efflux RND transporter permease subunit [Saprospiraceae bacterium]|nr:efflux RND transporter permease subunit [Saprospiraceae bacterium]
MNLTEFTIERSRIAISVFVLLAVMGMASYFTLSQNSMPPYAVRVASVVAPFPGASPERVENLVSRKIEEKIQEIPELKEINTQSRSGLSVATIILKDEVAPEKLQSIWDRVRRKLNTIKFPDGVKYNLRDDDIGEVYGIMLGLVSENDLNGQMDFSYAEMKKIADDIRDEIIALNEAAKVEIGGHQTEQIFVEFDNAQMASLNITAAQVQGILAGTNILYSGGELNIGDERIIIEPTGNFDNVNDIKNTIIRVQNGQALLLQDIAKITRGYEQPESQIIKVDGKRALSLSIALKDGANVVNLGIVIDEKIGEINQTLPIGLELKRLSSLDKYVDAEVSNFVSNLIQTVGLVLIVMLIFLGFRTGLIIASLVPMVILATFLFMGMFGQGINQVTLAALIMALGLMVDNGVVVAETVLVKIEDGLSKLQSVKEACDELIIPLLISTLTTSVAFMSFYLAEGTMGDIVGPLFVVISIALVCSWVLSMTMVTMMCFYFLKVQKQAKEKQSIVDRSIDYLKDQYEKLINVALRHKVVSLVSVFGLFFGSLMLFGQIPFLFFPDSERNLITVDIKLPQGTRLETTSALVEELEAYILGALQVNENRKRGVLDWSAFVGKGPESYDLGYSPDEANANYAHMLVNTSSGDHNGYVIAKLDSFSFASFPTADIKVKRLSSGGGGTPIEIKVFGNDGNVLSEISKNIKTKLNDQTGSKNVKDNWGPKTKKIVIDIDPLKTQNAGLTNQDIAISLKTALNGFDIGNYREGKDNISIIMRDINHDRVKIENIESINIYSQNTGINVPLSQVAELEVVWQFANILRSDLKRSINISSQVREGGNASEIMGAVTPWLKDQQENNWPRGYTYKLGGDAENSAESMGAVAAWLPMAFFIIIMLLIIQFNSFRKTFIVLMTIPLGVIGVIFGLLILRSYFGFFAFLGIISLAGIIINNAIVLIDRIEIESNLNENLVGAIKTACLQRFRPIMLTTFTTVLGMIPLYLGGGIMWEPLAAAIMFGLLFGTIVTLIFVPVCYVLFYNRKKKAVIVES